LILQKPTFYAINITKCLCNTISGLHKMIYNCLIDMCVSCN